MLYRRLFVFCSIAALSVTFAQADWLRFRGPNGTGISSDSKPALTKWSPTENIKWKVALPGSGASSPIVVGEKAFVTCYSGYGIDRGKPGNIKDLKRHLVCVDRSSGEIAWTKTIDAAQPEDPYSGMGVPAHGYASHSPVSDGENVYVFFGKSGVFGFDLDGNQLWQTSVGTQSDSKRWGSASSPVVHGDVVIVIASAESRSLVGLNKKTGEEVWKQETDGVADVWGTPVLANVDDRTDLVLGVPYEFWGLSPETGKLRWYSEAMESSSYNSSVVVSDGVVYGIEGRGGGSAAVKIGGKGDITKENTIWTGNDSARFATPLVYDGRIYFFANGIASCINAKDGSSIFKGRLPSDNASGNGRDGGGGGARGGRGGRGGRGFGSIDYSSPVAADEKIYYVKSDGTTYVIDASEEFNLIATNKITEDTENFSGTPAISDGQIIVRSNKHLYCIGQ